ncbi:MAG: hypothetical protein ACKVOQ_01860 [Cyclobacteriaceae bacterium]
MTLFDQFLISQYHHFYPKNFSDINSNEYLSSEEFKKLCSISSFFNKDDSSWKEIEIYFQKSIDRPFKSRNFKGVTDRSYCFDIILDIHPEEYIRTITTNVSFIIPYYTIGVLYSPSNPVLPTISYSFNKISLEVKEIIDKKMQSFNYHEFPSELLGQAMPMATLGNMNPPINYQKAFFFDLQERRI